MIIIVNCQLLFKLTCFVSSDTLNYFDIVGQNGNVEKFK